MCLLTQTAIIIQSRGSPNFWEWLAEMGRLGRVKVPQEIYEEIVLPRPYPPDALVEWLIVHKDALLLDEAVEVPLVAQVTEQGYADDLTDEEIEKSGATRFSSPMPSAVPRNGAL